MPIQAQNCRRTRHIPTTEPRALRREHTSGGLAHHREEMRNQDPYRPATKTRIDHREKERTHVLTQCRDVQWTSNDGIGDPLDPTENYCALGWIAATASPTHGAHRRDPSVGRRGMRNLMDSTTLRGSATSLSSDLTPSPPPFAMGRTSSAASENSRTGALRIAQPRAVYRAQLARSG